MRTLALKETMPLAYPAPQMFGSGIKCDGNGNIFLPLSVFNSDGTVRANVLLEILPVPRSTKTFGAQPLPGSEYTNQLNNYFDVDAAGTVYGLAHTSENGNPDDKQPPVPQYFIEHFNSDGNTDSVVHLENPPGAEPVGLDPDYFGVFRDGSFVVAGMQWSASTGAEPFTAVYASNGKLIRRVELPDDVPGDQTFKTEHASSAQRDAAISAITLGALVDSPDGNIYLLRNSQPVRLYGVDSSGDVIKHFQISPPLPGLNVFSMGVVGEDSLLLHFAHPPPQHPGEKTVSQWLVGIFNVVSGQFDAVYKLPAKAFGVPACGDQHGGLLFIGDVGRSGDRHLAVFDYGP